MTDKPFRVLLDVTDLYLENFKYVWINVSPRELRTIFDFKKYILRKINLEKDVQLFVRDGLLLDEETIVILREDDTVKVKHKTSLCQNSEKGSEEENANFSRKRNLNESNVYDEDINLKRHKPEVVTLSSNENGDNFIEKKSKKEKRKSVDSVINSMYVYCSSEEKKKKQPKESVNSENVCFTSKEKRKKQKESPINSADLCSTSVENGEKQTDSLVNFENCHSTFLKENQKKSSKKKSKKMSIAYNETLIDTDFSNTKDSFYSFNANCIQQKQNKSDLSSKPVTSVESESVPIVVLSNDSYKEDELNFHLNDSSEAVIIDNNSKNSNNQSKRKRKRCRKRKKSSVSAIDSCDVTDNSKSFSENINNSFRGKHILYLSPDRNEKSNCLDDASEICNLSSDTFVLQEEKLADIQSQDYPKMSTPAQANNCGVPDLQLSMMPEKNSISSCNENNSEQNDKLAIKHKTAQNNTENKSAKQLYEDLPDITSLPVVGIYIAYKVLELDENYSPTVSDYREGIIERINSNTEEIEIRFKKEVILPVKSGKFENLGKDEVPEPTIKTYDVLKWSDIISPKLLSGLLE